MIPANSEATFADLTATALGKLESGRLGHDAWEIAIYLLRQER